MDKFLSIFQNAKSIVKAGKTAVDFATNPIGTLSKYGGNKLLSEQQKPQPFSASPLGLATNTLLGLPKATYKSAKFVSDELTKRTMNIPNVLNQQFGARRADESSEAYLERVSGPVMGATDGGGAGLRKIVKGAFDYSKAVKGLNNTGRSAIMDFVAGSKEVDKRFVQDIANKMNLPNVMGTDKALREDFIKVLDADRQLTQQKFAQQDLATKAKAIVKDGKQAATQPRDTIGRFDVKPYTGETDLTIKTLEKLKGRSTVSKTFISDLSNASDLKQSERDVIRKALESEGDTVNVPKFAEKVKDELLPLKATSSKGGEPRYESVSLPDDVRGNVANYEERVYQSPIKTSAGDVHFSGEDNKNYFGHTRIEDMADNKTRRVIEVQSDLYQKGNLERELNKGTIPYNNSSQVPVEQMRNNGWSEDQIQKAINDADGGNSQIISDNQKRISKLQQYSNPTAHFRLVREEIKKAAEDGKTKLQFPTGETAMKIEGLGTTDNQTWRLGEADNLNSELLENNNLFNKKLVGETISRNGENWIITDVLGDGKFKAVQKKYVDMDNPKNWEYSLDNSLVAEGGNPAWMAHNTVTNQREFIQFIPEKKDAALKHLQDRIGAQGKSLAEIGERHAETFDISGKVDTNNPIYRFYEKDLGRYLKNNYNAKPVTDKQGVTWYELDITTQMGKAPVEAFGAFAGFEQDEEGKLRFDPMKAAFGVAGMAAFNRGKGFMKKGVVSGDPIKTLRNVEKDVGVKPFSFAGSLSKKINPEIELEKAGKLQNRINEARLFGRTLKQQRLAEAKSRIRKSINRAEYDPDHFARKPVQLTPELEQKAIGIEIAKESIANNPLNQLVKYASKTGENAGKLPEVLGGKGTSGFKKKGDDIITEITGKNVDSETVRADFEKFVAQKKAVQEAEVALKQEIKALRYSSEGIPLAPTARQKAVLESRTSSSAKPIDTEVASLEKLAEQSTKAEIRDPQLRSYASLPKIIERTPTPVKAKINMLDYVRTPENVLKKIGLSKQFEVVRRGYDGYLKELPQNLNKITEWSKQVPKESSARLFKYLDGQAINLTPQELKVANEIKVWLAEWADRLGLPEDNRIANYITHLFDDQLIAKEFDEDLAKIIAEKVPSSVYDPFLQKRLGAKGYKEDVWKALDAYVKRGTRKVHMDPALQVLEEASTGLEQSQWNYVKRFADRVNMRPTEIDNVIDNGIKAMFGYRVGQRPVTTITQTLRRATYRGMLGLNVGSALRNLSQGINTYAKLGEKYTIIGYSKLFSPANLKELQTENVLTSQFVQDRSISAIKTAMQKADKGLFFFFETAEKINRGAAYFGAKAKGLANGMSERQAIEYGKKIVRETQFAFGSIDTPVGMSSDIVKTLTQFQTFTTKQIEFLAGMAKNKEYAGLIRYAISGAAFVYTIGQAFGMDIKDLLPIYRLGTPPSLKFPVTAVQIAAGGDKDAGDLVSTLPGYIPGGVQAKKTIQGVQSVKEGGSYDKAGKLQFKQGESKAQQLQSILFGKYAGKNAKRYFRGEKPTRTISDIKKSIASDLKSGKIDVSVAKERYIGEVKELASREKKTRSTMPIDAFKKDLARAIEEKVITVEEAKKEYIEYTKKIETEESRALAMKTEYPDKDIKTLVKVYAKALGTDPVNAFKALLTSEKIDDVKGNAVLLQRMKGAHFLNPGGSEEYMKERLSSMNIPWSKREDYNLEHIVPVGAGGSNDDGNLQIISRALHDSYSAWDTKAGNAVKNGTMTRGEVAKIAKKLKVDKSITVESALKLLR